jgi:transcriptional regulator with XRE-family HTH domain
MKANNVDQNYLITERKRIGLELKLKREAKGLTMQQLADEMGISMTTISKVEAGKWNFGVDTISSIGVFLGFKIDLN